MLAGLAIGASAALITGFGQVLMAATSRRVGTSFTTALALTASLLWFLPLFAITAFPPAGVWWLQVSILGVVNAAAFLLVVEALRRGPLSVVGPVAASVSVVTVVLAALLLDERLPPIALLAIPLVGAGAILCATTAKAATVSGLSTRSSVEVGVIYMAAGVFLIGLYTVWLQAPVRDVGFVPSVLAARLVSIGAIAAAVVVQIAVARRRGRLGPSIVGLAAIRADPMALIGAVTLIGLSLSVALLLLAASLIVAPAWLIGASMALSPAVVVVAGVVVYKERLPRLHVIGIAAIGLGVAMLTVYLAVDAG